MTSARRFFNRSSGAFRKTFTGGLEIPPIDGPHLPPRDVVGAFSALGFLASAFLVDVYSFPAGTGSSQDVLTGGRGDPTESGSHSYPVGVEPVSGGHGVATESDGQEQTRPLTGPRSGGISRKPGPSSQTQPRRL